MPIVFRDSPEGERRQNTGAEYTYSIDRGDGAAGTAWRPAQAAREIWPPKRLKPKPVVRTSKVLHFPSTIRTCRPKVQKLHR